MDFEGVPPPLTDSDNSEVGSDSDMDGTSDYGSRTGNDDSDHSDSEESTPPPPEVEHNAPPSKNSEDLRTEGNELFREGKYADAIHKYEEAIRVGKGNVENKAKCYSNITHCYNKKKDYNKAVHVAFKGMEAMPDFPRVFVRCATAFVNLDEPKMAAMALMKGQAWSPSNAELQQDLMKIDELVRDEARKYLAKYYKNNAKDINLKKLREKGFKKDKEEKNEASGKKTKELPGLVESSHDDSSDSTCSEDLEDGGKPAQKKYSPKKKSLRHHSNSSKASSKSADDSSDDETSQKTSKKGPSKKNAERIRKENEELRMKEQIEEVKKKEEEKKAGEKKKAEEEKKAAEKKKADELKRKEEERKKIIAMNDPKETAWMNFNDTLSEASSCFMRSPPNWSRSKEKYAEALDVIAKSFNNLKFKTKSIKNCEEVVVIKFMFARACTNTNNYPDIITGYAKLQEIVTAHKEVRFPAVYLGFALMFKKLNRYDHALQYTEKGVDLFDKNLPCVTFNYPGIPSQPLEDTNPDYLKKTFNNLKVEFKCPPKPEAICKYKDCLEVNKNNHIIPSENIYLSDPDFRGYFKVWCRSNCALDYHENCWGALKIDFINIINKTSKTPTEKDFFGLKCFTPDCEGLIIRIQIFDSYGDCKTLEDKKLLEKIENEEKTKKEEERKKKEKDAKENQQRKLEERKKNKKRKDRNKSSSEKDSDSVKDDVIKVESGPKVVIPANLPTVENYSKTSTPPPDISLDQVTILKKHKEVEEESTDKKKHKKTKDRTMHLEEFKNSDGTAIGMPDASDYQSRIERLAATKKAFEENMSKASSESSNPPSNFHNTKPPLGAKTLEEKMDNYLNPNASVFNPNQSDKLSKEVIEESVKSFVLQTLKIDGPLKETDIRFTREFGPEAKTMIMERRGLINFLKNDDRFSSYADCICLRGDAEKAKKVNDQEAKARENADKKPVSNLGEMARKMREQLEREQEAAPEVSQSAGAFGLAKAASEASILDSIKKNAADIGFKAPIIESSARNIRDLGVQTDVSSLDLDELDDPLVLKQSNAALIAELQESKDKLYKIQNERKVESKEMVDKVRALNEDKNKLKVETTNLKETIQKMNKTYKEAAKKEEELRQVKDTLESEHQKSGLMKVDLNNTKLRLENEQRLSFQLNSQLQSSRDQEVVIKTLKLKCLKTEFDGIKSFLMGKNGENEKLMTYLANLNNNETHQSFNTIKSSIEKLNEYSARLYRALDDLQAKYDEKVRQVERNPGSDANVNLNFDSSSLDSHQLNSVEVDTLRLLTSVNLNSRPQVAPFPNYPNTTRPPPSRPPGLLGPPPGLPPMSEASSSIADNLTSIRAAISRPRAASSPRPDPATSRPAATAAAARPTSTLAVTRPAAAGVPRAAAAAAEGKPKSYQKLLTQLQGRYPELSTSDANKYIQMLRDNNNGKLSGMSIQVINERVGQFMVADRDRRRAENDTDNNCSICLEDMTERDSRRLNPCHHKFHNQCINVSYSFVLFNKNLTSTFRTGLLPLEELATRAPCAGTISSRRTSSQT